jgi:hypothetical protein
MEPIRADRAISRRKAVFSWVKHGQRSEGFTGCAKKYAWRYAAKRAQNRCHIQKRDFDDILGEVKDELRFYCGKRWMRSDKFGAGIPPVPFPQAQNCKKQPSKTLRFQGFSDGDPSEIRTPDTLIKRERNVQF